MPGVPHEGKTTWKVSKAPSDGGFAHRFASFSAATGCTVRSCPSMSLGKPYFSSVPLLRLDISGATPVEITTATAIGEAWQGCLEFRSFTLRRKSRAGEFKSYVRSFRTAPLLEVDLAGANLAPGDLTMFVEAIATNTYRMLVSLDLSGTNLSEKKLVEKFAVELDGALPPPPAHSFRDLRFIGCQLSAVSAGKLLSMISRRCSQLEVLRLSDNPLVQGTDPASAGLAELSAVWTSKALRDVRVRGTNLPLSSILPDPGANVRACKRDTLDLDLSGCRIGGDTGTRLAPILAEVSQELLVVAKAMKIDAPVGRAAYPLVCQLGIAKRGKAVLDFTDCQVPLSSLVAVELAEQVVLIVGSSTKTMCKNRVSASLGQLPSKIDQLSVLPRSLVMHNVFVEDGQRLQSTLLQVSTFGNTSWDPKCKTFGDEILGMLGVGSAKSGSIPLTGEKTHMSEYNLDLIRNLLESSSSIESLVITGSSSSNENGELTTHVYPQPVNGASPSKLPVALPFGAGPSLVRALQGLAANRSLLHLDVSFNFMGDAGGIMLGNALKVNRTLQSLNLDGNFISVIGWLCFRKCLYGNKRLTQFTIPQADLDWANAAWGTMLSRCNELVLQSKAAIKRAFKSTKGRRTPAVVKVLNTEVEKITTQKRMIGSINRLGQKLVTVQKQIHEDVLRNQKLFEQSPKQAKSIAPMWAEAQACLKRIARAEAKLKPLQEAQKELVMNKREKVWGQWCKKADKLGAKDPQGLKWFDGFRQKKLLHEGPGTAQYNRLSPAQATLLLSCPQLGRGNAMREQFIQEIELTKNMLANEQGAQAKVDAVNVAIQRDTLALESLTYDPAWSSPPAGGLYDDVEQWARNASSKPPSKHAPKLLPIMPLGVQETPPTNAPPTNASVESAETPPTNAPAESAKTAGPGHVEGPVVIGTVVGTPVPAHASTQYDKMILQRQRVAVQKMRLTRQGGQQQSSVNQRNQQNRGNSYGRDDGYYGNYGYGYGGYGYSSYGYYGYGYNDYGYGYHDYGDSDCYDHHHHYGCDDYDPNRDSYYTDDHADHGFQGDGGFLGDEGGEDFPTDGQGGDEPFAGDAMNQEDAAVDEGDAAAAGYGAAGGEEPPLPDGGRDEPRAEPVGLWPGEEKGGKPCQRSVFDPRERRRQQRNSHLPSVSCSSCPLASRSLARAARHSSSLSRSPTTMVNWEKGLQRAEEVAMGAWLGTIHKDLPYLKEMDVLGTRDLARDCRAGTCDVCIISQCSTDRLDKLRAQCVAWAPGACSAAIFLRETDSREDALVALKEINAACVELGGCLVGSFLHELPQDWDNESVCGRDPAAAEYDRLYPANALRNIAMEQATGDLVFVLDVDFVPSRGLHGTLTKECPGDIRNFLAQADDGSVRALVVPALEMQTSANRDDNVLPVDFLGVEELGKRISGFHVDHFPQGHGATDYERWRRFARLSEKDSQPFSYGILYEEYFEPYIVANRSCLPRFDERFRGYGLNKCSFVRHCHAIGIRFGVLVRGGHFVVAAEHEKSTSWERNFGIGADPANALKIALVWRIFLRSLGVLSCDLASGPVSTTQAPEVPRVVSGASCAEIASESVATMFPLSVDVLSTARVV
eukprot:TRINITY_DN2916_c0_g4_i1.p1 TRINITY_DN2916_c0_g4~~TRINITY_DN2916_c0_g4_i1.p1  ORF type:complete len:1846 (-),score=235.92 TRINITY_DN2916_c0_g4_i1:31-4842(-)